MSSSVVTHVRYVAQAVPDFRASREFYSGIWGLTEVARDGDVCFLAAEGSDEPYALRLRQADERHLDLLALGVGDRAAVHDLAERLGKAGFRIEREPGDLDLPGGGYGFRFFDIDGRLVEVSADVSPRKARELEEHEAIPRKLSHVVINSPNIHQTLAFYENYLGFVLSDWLGDTMCFLRVGTEHHVLAISRSPHVSFNHVAWDISSLDSYLRATGRLMRTGTRPVWGPGRHGPGNNTFSYFVDPNNNVTEFTSDLQVICDPDAWQPSVWETTPEASDQWGTGGLMDEFIPFAVGQPDRLLWTPSPL